MVSPLVWTALLALLVGPSASVFVDQGFLLTTPKVLTAGTTERFCISFFKLERTSVYVRVYLLPKANSTNSQSVARVSKTYYIRKSGLNSRCFSMGVPKNSRTGTLYIRASVRAAGFDSTKTSPIRVLGYTLVTLVQTDKTKYKAGQTVLFRVVTLKSDLTAQEEVVKQIYLTTPAGTRLAQWDNVKTRSGIIQEKFQLTDEPPLGMWAIHVRRGDRITKQTFEVAEFTLPRFEVTITGPKFIVRHANTVTLKVCAKYTFGKPVTSAAVALFVARSVPSYFYRRNRFGTPDRRGDAPSNITLTDKSDTDGCAEFDVLLSKIGVDKKTETNLRIFVSQVQVKANVTEAGTGLLQSSDLVIRIQTPRLSIQIDNQAGTEFLKPNLEYIGYATVKGADGEPMEKETLRVCHSDRFRDQGAIKPILKSSERRYPYGSKGRGRVRLSNPAFTKLPIIHPPVSTKTKSGACREYNSDKNGRIRFRIPKQPAGILSVNVNIRSTRTGISSSSASKNLRAWFSLSSSFITIVPQTDPFGLKCKGAFRVKVVTTTKPPGLMTYLVMTRGQIVTQGQVRSGGFINIRLGFFVSPSFKLLVYYVNDLGEVISDSRAFDVAKCFQNQVSVAWNKKQVKPGEQATLTIRGSPNSLCGVTAVDRSVELLSDKNKLTAESIFGKLQQFIIRQYSSPRLDEGARKYCMRKPRFARPTYFGFEGFDPAVSEFREQEAELDRAVQQIVQAPAVQPRRILPGRPVTNIYYTTVLDDSIKAFDVAGYLPLTNLVLESRPCEKNNRSSFELPILESSVASRQFAVAASTAAVGAGAVDDAGSSSSSAPAPLETAVRSLFPETCLFQLQGLGWPVTCR